MKKISSKALVWNIILAIVIVLGIWCITGYNSMVGLKESVNTQSANIQTQLQRRADLIPNLVSVVKKYTNHESEIMTQIAQSREKLVGAQSLNEKAAANAEISSALSRLLVIVEQYPNLKADTQFTALTDELAGTENRIATSRKDYNSAVQNYNTSIKRFPTVVLANIFGYTAAESFEASESSRTAPVVNFE